MRLTVTSYVRSYPQAQDVLLLIEVADSSLAFDQGAKLSLYARYGVPEHWVIDVHNERLFAYGQPSDGAYQRFREVCPGETIAPAAFRRIRIAISELFAWTVAASVETDH
jgi:Uma2 family endonuclease